jgi:hypothetical protein
MQAAVEAALPADIAVMAAAVADWRVDQPGAEKLKKQPGEPAWLGLVENPDILAGLSRHPQRPALVIGFAAETEDLLANAATKLRRKGCDWIVANDVSPETGIMGGTRNRVHLVTAAGVEDWPEMSKIRVAEELVTRIADYFSEPAPNAAPLHEDGGLEPELDPQLYRDSPAAASQGPDADLKPAETTESEPEAFSPFPTVRSIFARNGERLGAHRPASIRPPRWLKAMPL